MGSYTCILATGTSLRKEFASYDGLRKGFPSWGKLRKEFRRVCADLRKFREVISSLRKFREVPEIFFLLRNSLLGLRNGLSSLRNGVSSLPLLRIHMANAYLPRLTSFASYLAEISFADAVTMLGYKV